VADGWFGPLTDEAVRHFQDNNGLTADGIVGPLTWQRLFGKFAVPASVTRTPLPTKAPSPTPAVRYPRVDGAPSTFPLQIVLAAKQFGAEYEWRMGFDEWFPYVDYESVAGWPDIYHRGTHKAYTRLIDGKTDFILVPREPTADELSAAQAQGVTLEITAVARDGLVFLVNYQNSTNTLTLEQARGIYAGQIKDWSEVGGQAGAITPYQRDVSSGYREVMDKLVMQGTPMILGPDMLPYDSFGPFNMINIEPLGLGYAGYYYMAVIAPQMGFKLLSLNGVAPTSETIAQRTYPLLCDVYAVVRAGLPADDPAIRLRDWVLSDAGQAAVAESRYVPIR